MCFVCICICVQIQRSDQFVMSGPGLLSEQGKVGLMGSQRQHDQVSIKSIEAMPGNPVTPETIFNRG